VPLHIRKALVARMMAYEEIEPRLAGCGDREVALARETTDLVDAQTKTELRAPNNSEPLDEFVRRVITKGVDVQSESEVLRSATNPLVHRANSLSCTACANPDRPCDGRKDDVILDRSGDCIIQLRRMVAMALRIARAYYEYACGMAAIQWPEVRFATYHMTETPHPYATPVAVSGRTDFEPHITVAIVFHPEGFNWPSYLAIPYILLHEGLHILEAVESKGKRLPADDEDPFVEGWIDWIAFRALEEAAVGRGPGAAAATDLANAAEVVYRGRLLHDARGDEVTSRRPHISRRIREGHKAAMRMADLCERYIKPDEEPWRFFLAVSFTLNMKALTLNEHRLLVSRVNRAMPARSELTPPRFVDETLEFRRFFETKDVPGLVGWLVREI
jgi:hypothetical protein